MRGLFNDGAWSQSPLRTRRFLLEPVHVGHAVELHRMLADTELHLFVPMESPTVDQQRERCARWAKRRSPDGSEIWLNWVTRDEPTGELVAHFQAGLKEDGVASVGYVVARRFQRMGVAAEGLRAVLDYLHAELGAIEAKAWSDTRNLASHRLAERLGMSNVGFIKDADFFKGATSDEFVFSIKFGDREDRED